MSGDGEGGGGLGHALRAFRHRDFRIFWFGALASNAGTWLANLAVPYVLFQLTHSALWVGLASVAQLAPGVLLGPLGGSLADRLPRRRLLLVTQSGMAAGSLALWLCWILGRGTPGVIMVTLAFTSLFAGINLPCWQAFVTDLVPRVDLSSAVALNSLQFNAARCLGPALAGALLATLGPSWAFLINAISFLCVLLALALLRARVGRPQTTADAGVLAGFRAATAYVGRQPGIQAAIVLSVLVGFLGNPLFSLTVVFANETFHVGAVGLGLMNAAIGVGCLLAAPLVSGWVRWLTLSRLARCALPLYAVAMAAFALSPGLGVALAMLALVGAAYLSLVSAANTAIQLIVAAPMRGRVMAVRIMLFTGSMPLGSLTEGWLTDRFGPRATVAGVGVLLGVAALVLGRGRANAWMGHLDDPHDEAFRQMERAHPDQLASHGDPCECGHRLGTGVGLLGPTASAGSAGTRESMRDHGGCQPHDSEPGALG